MFLTHMYSALWTSLRLFKSDQGSRSGLRHAGMTHVRGIGSDLGGS